jgi:hypothetical protein
VHGRVEVVPEHGPTIVTRASTRLFDQLGQGGVQRVQGGNQQWSHEESQVYHGAALCNHAGPEQQYEAADRRDANPKRSPPARDHRGAGRHQGSQRRTSRDQYYDLPQLDADVEAEQWDHDVVHGKACRYSANPAP